MARRKKTEEIKTVDKLEEIETLKPDLELLDSETYDIDDVVFPENETETITSIEEDIDFENEQKIYNEFETIKKEEPTNNKDINSIFEKASSNIMEALNIFNQNMKMKEELDEKFVELDKIKTDFEIKKNADYDKIKNYKEEVYAKVTEKKQEIELKLNELKDFQKKLIEEKEKFEKYKNDEINKIKEVRKQQKAAFENKQNELNLLETNFKKEQEKTNELKRQLELNRIKYDSDKNELANNLLKFNELVSDFTVNIDKFNGN